MADPLSYEDARDELIAVVQRLETGGTSLQESIELWERGEELAQICQRWLDGARARLDAVMDARTDDRNGPNLDGPGADGPVAGDAQ
ncbi:MAG TPA: exodeoxyribonuclease VII small subunit [Nocardioidaceae bacterium]|nr:exodeoxyribonuclease VII small subunit [Nocardioidaceae bacterium]